MLDKMYELNLTEALPGLEDLEFPEILKTCRELMGLKQYACGDYLGFELPRYKKIEQGMFSEPLEAWELKRLETFFKLPKGMLQKKQKAFLTKRDYDRKVVCKNIWCSAEATKGSRCMRDGAGYRRVKGTLDG